MHINIQTALLTINFRIPRNTEVTSEASRKWPLSIRLIYFPQNFLYFESISKTKKLEIKSSNIIRNISMKILY